MKNDELIRDCHFHFCGWQQSSLKTIKACINSGRIKEALQELDQLNRETSLLLSDPEAFYEKHDIGQKAETVDLFDETAPSEVPTKKTLLTPEERQQLVDTHLERTARLEAEMAKDVKTYQEIIGG